MILYNSCAPREVQNKAVHLSCLIIRLRWADDEGIVPVKHKAKTLQVLIFLVPSQIIEIGRIDYN